MDSQHCKIIKVLFKCKMQKKENFRAKYSSQKAEKMTTDLKVLTEEGFLVNTETMSLSKDPSLGY